MGPAACPHCGANNPEGAEFCASCGKVVGVAGGGPRLVTGDSWAVTRTGQSLQAQELSKQCKKSFGALLAVGILQAIFGTIVVFAMSQNQTAESARVSIGAVAITVYGIAALFLGLALWARRSPLPAAIVGLVVFITVHALDAIGDPTALARGIIMKIIIIGVLVRAIQAGVRHRTLSRGVAAI